LQSICPTAWGLTAALAEAALAKVNATMVAQANRTPRLIDPSLCLVLSGTLACRYGSCQAVCAQNMNAYHQGAAPAPLARGRTFTDPPRRIGPADVDAYEATMLHLQTLQREVGGRATREPLAATAQAGERLLQAAENGELRLRRQERQVLRLVEADRNPGSPGELLHQRSQGRKEAEVVQQGRGWRVFDPYDSKGSYGYLLSSHRA